MRAISTTMNSWQHLRNKSNVVRKSLAFANLIPSAVVRLGAHQADYKSQPPLLANSFPQSGTHLLIQILQAFPNARYFGSFLASMTSSITFRELSRHAYIKRINLLTPGEVIGAHLFFDPAYVEALHRLNAAHFFIYRDPRDVVVSEAHYLTDMNRWHRMHAYYARRLKTLDERISAAILGVQEAGFPYDYPDIGRRFERYGGWLNRDDVIAVRFEDLVSENRPEVLRGMIQFVAQRTEIQLNPEPIIDEMERNIDPRTSHTFRKGEPGGWRSTFTRLHETQMKSVAGRLLIDLGYEKDLDW